MKKVAQNQATRPSVAPATQSSPKGPKSERRVRTAGEVEPDNVASEEIGVYINPVGIEVLREGLANMVDEAGHARSVVMAMVEDITMLAGDDPYAGGYTDEALAAARLSVRVRLLDVIVALDKIERNGPPAEHQLDGYTPSPFSVRHSDKMLGLLRRVVSRFEMQLEAARAEQPRVMQGLK